MVAVSCQYRSIRGSWPPQARRSAPRGLPDAPPGRAPGSGSLPGRPRQNPAGTPAAPPPRRSRAPSQASPWHRHQRAQRDRRQHRPAGCGRRQHGAGAATSTPPPACALRPGTCRIRCRKPGSLTSSAISTQASTCSGEGSSGRFQAAPQRGARAGLGSRPPNTSARKSSIICRRSATDILASLFIKVISSLSAAHFTTTVSTARCSRSARICASSAPRWTAATSGEPGKQGIAVHQGRYAETAGGGAEPR